MIVFSLYDGEGMKFFETLDEATERAVALASEGFKVREIERCVTMDLPPERLFLRALNETGWCHDAETAMTGPFKPGENDAR